MTSGSQPSDIFDGKLCPRCGNPLRFYEIAGASMTHRQILSELVFWIVLAGILAVLWSSNSTDERLVMFVVLAVWFVWRRRPRSDPAENIADRHYFCEICHAYVDNDDLHER